MLPRKERSYYAATIVMETGCMINAVDNIKGQNVIKDVDRFHARNMQTDYQGIMTYRQKSFRDLKLEQVVTSL